MLEKMEKEAEKLAVLTDMEPMVWKALKLATMAHGEQVRKFGGDPYITHPIAVAALFKDPDLKTIALLHDVLEDTDTTEKDLLDGGFPHEVVLDVVALTRKPEEKYAEFILRIKTRPRARAVKVADLLHNMRSLPVESTLRARYEKALITLIE